jgi:plasmid stabilization system protein ParE
VKQSSIRFSDVALSDILEQFDWYEHHSGLHLAKRWENAVASALIRIVKNPDSGAPCHFDAVELQRIRRTGITRFPKHLIFYRIEKTETVILRVVHGARDLESLS